MRNLQKITFFAAMILPLLGIPKFASAEEDLRSAVQNPISSLISLPFRFSFDRGAGNGDGTILNIQPVVPVNIGEWNLVNRAPSFQLPM